MPKNQKPLVFISHLVSERDIAIAFKSLIEHSFLGLIEVFVSSDNETIPVGDRWLERISDALKRCVAEVVICSPTSISRPWINFEAGAGWVREIPVIPICHSGLTPSQLPIPLNQLQAIGAKDVIGLERTFKRFASVLHSKTPNIDFTLFVNSVIAFEKKAEGLGEIRKVYERSADLQHDLSSLIKSTAREIILCGVHFKISLSDRRPDYLDAIKKGVALTIAVLEPDSEAVTVTAQTYGMALDELRAECNEGIKVLKGFQNDYETLKKKAPNCATLKILTFSRIPRVRGHLKPARAGHFKTGHFEGLHLGRR